MFRARFSLLLVMLALLAAACTSTQTVGGPDDTPSPQLSVDATSAPSAPDIESSRAETSTSGSVEPTPTTSAPDIESSPAETSTSEPIDAPTGTQAELEAMFARTTSVSALGMERVAQLEMLATGELYESRKLARMNRELAEGASLSELDRRILRTQNYTDGIDWVHAAGFAVNGTELAAEDLSGAELFDPGWYLRQLLAAAPTIQSVTVDPATGVSRWELTFPLTPSAQFMFGHFDAPLLAKPPSLTDRAPATLHATASGVITEITIDFTGFYERHPGMPDGSLEHRATTSWRFEVLNEWTPVLGPCDDYQLIQVGPFQKLGCTKDIGAVDFLAWERVVLAEVEGRGLNRDTAGDYVEAALRTCTGDHHDYTPERQLVLLREEVERSSTSNPEAVLAKMMDLYDTLVSEHCGLVPWLPPSIAVDTHDSSRWGSVIGFRFERSGGWTPAWTFELIAIAACEGQRAPSVSPARFATLSENLWESLSATQGAELVDLYESGDCEDLDNPTLRKSMARATGEMISLLGEDLAREVIPAMLECVAAEVAAGEPVPSGENAEGLFIPRCAPDLLVRAHSPWYQSAFINSDVAICIAETLVAHAAETLTYYYGDNGPATDADRVVITALLKDRCDLDRQQFAILPLFRE